MAANPQSRIGAQGKGAGTGGLINQYRTEKSKLPRGPAHAKQLQELRMKYQKMGADVTQLE